MKKNVCFLIFLSIGLCTIALLQGDTDTSPTKERKNATADWHKDDVCQFFYFAILEGLYRDGISDEVVNLVLGNGKLKKNFVFKCKLCHAVFDAFSLYRTRPKFYGSELNTFSINPANEKILKSLSNADDQIRIRALMDLTRPWVKYRIKMHRLTKPEAATMQKRLSELVKEGIQLTEGGKTNSFMKGWGSTCWACEFFGDMKSDISKN